jgi:hypothetical protein
MAKRQEKIKTFLGRCLLRKRNLFMALALALVLLLAGVALAVNVNLSGAVSGTYTLNSMSISSDGTISLSVSGGGGGQQTLTLSTSPSTLPAGIVDTPYSESVTMSASNGTIPYSYSCSTSGAGITASSSGNVCSISGTPTSSGTYSVSFRVDDNAGDTAQRTSYFSVNSNGGGGGGIGAKELTNANSVRRVEIKPNETHYYYFDIPSGTGAMMVSMGTNDWKTNQDMMFSLGEPRPTSNDYPVGESFTVNGEMINGSRKWARIVKGGSNESYVISDNVIPGTYYIMVHNTSNIDGKYELYYYAN